MDGGGVSSYGGFWWWGIYSVDLKSVGVLSGGFWVGLFITDEEDY